MGRGETREKEKAEGGREGGKGKDKKVQTGGEGGLEG